MSGEDRPRSRLFGVVLAGGQSRRYGSPKARVRLAGETLLERALAILHAAGLETGVIANRADDLPAGHPRAAVPVRPDLTPGAGPLGGLHAALAWARERGDGGVFLLGCDLPLVPPALVARLATGSDAARPTVPASPGPLGIEPLCACYPISLAAAAQDWLATGRFGMGEFVRAHDPVVVAPDQLASVAGAEHAFLNVNTPADLARAASLLSVQAKPE
ncbi:MAG: molybdenum cofactor guanylyltransferase [Gammaproteobacteria bacterium]|nr:molybdenum cofactor guanylyltransferase [Gammaproteobacteria bacterium]